METQEQIKDMVRRKYQEIATQDITTNKASCCGSGCCSTEVATIMSEEYQGLEGYAPDADLGLGCGLPTEYARIQPGDTVVDLGSGAGNDAFVARAETGEDGRVIGIDFTPAMIEKAKQNATKLGYSNVEFRTGDIDHMPLSDNLADVVISNCVLNLVPDKEKVFREIFRVLKPGSHFCISDIVLEGTLPEALIRDAEMYAGCVSGAVSKEEYLAIIRSTGFESLTVEKQKFITIPDDILLNSLTEEELVDFKQRNTGIVSITVYAQKPKSCCTTECCKN